MVEELGLKAYWVGESMLYSMRCFMSCLLIMVSRILAIIGRREIGRKFFGKVVSEFLYISITFVILMESGYWFSSMALLKSLVRCGAMKFLRLLRIAGLILKMSEALLGFRVRRSLSTSSRDVGWREKGGCVVFVLGAIIRSSCWRGICRLVLCPIVM